jgi:predicted 3-demethylubiquinone-9 3-methyltransferase (glyoxalase superfamily)
MALRQKITTFLWFDDNAEEAMDFYVSLFRDSRVVGVSRFEASPPGPGGTVVIGTFQLAGQEFMALNGGPHFRFNEAISLLVSCDSQEEVDELWEKLTADGGEPGVCGWLKDRFGLSWQIVPSVFFEMMEDQDAKRRQRVTDAVMRMTKIEVTRLHEAYGSDPAVTSGG